MDACSLPQACKDDMHHCLNFIPKDHSHLWSKHGRRPWSVKKWKWPSSLN